MVLKIYCQQKTVMSYSDGFWKITIKKMNVGEFVAVVGTSGSKRWVNAGSTIPYEAGIISIMQAGPFSYSENHLESGGIRGNMLTRRFAFVPPCEAAAPISDEWRKTLDLLWELMLCVAMCL